MLLWLWPRVNIRLSSIVLEALYLDMSDRPPVPRIRSYGHGINYESF
jgi:hypothetical protein